MEDNFVKADSTNLPKLDVIMVATYFATNPDFCSAEYRNIKTSVSSRESYGDDAIGYVQVSRNGDLCTLKCKICPEHKVHKKPYNVTLKINEKESRVLSVQCHDCIASQGGCKHAVAFMMWVHRRSEEPSSTSRECYWKKPRLAQIGGTVRFVTVKQLANAKHQSTTTRKYEVLSKFISEAKKRNLQNCQLIKHLTEHEDELHKFSLHKLCMKYNKYNTELFLQLLKPIFTDENIEKIKNNTVHQNKTPLWYELRYGRVTASIAYTTYRCKTTDGSLVATIMGGRTPETSAMKRGNILEEKVRDEVAIIIGQKIARSGLYISQQYPILAGSPDGITQNNIVEIKCPLNERTYLNYIKDGKVTEKYYCQMQMQMYVTGFTTCYFCVADSAFENNKKVEIIKVKYDEAYFINVLQTLITFWKNNIYPLLQQSAKV